MRLGRAAVGFLRRRQRDLCFKRIVFVTGVGRSGTTAMTDLLNQHPQVCIGIERYKRKFLRDARFEGHEFTAARFFDFRPRDTNLLPSARGRWKAFYAQMETKYPHARVVGDKIPHLFDQYARCTQTFAQARWIYMLRDIDAVAASWNARAHNPRDPSWPAEHDYRMAVETWNRANAIVAALPADRVKVIRYETFFAEEPGALCDLLALMGLQNSPDFAARTRPIFETYSRLKRDKPLLLRKSHRTYIRAHADPETYAKLVLRSRLDQDAPAASGLRRTRGDPTLRA